LTKKKRKIFFNCSGHIGQTVAGNYITTQTTDLEKEYTSTKDQIIIQAPFYKMSRLNPTPFLFFILRFFNLTVMRSEKFCNFIKKLLATLIIRSKRPVPLHLERTISFNEDNIKISDRLRGNIGLRWLEHGRPFVSIHMASARYFEGSESLIHDARRIPVESFQNYGEIHQKVTICPDN